MKPTLTPSPTQFHLKRSLNVFCNDEQGSKAGAVLMRTRISCYFVGYFVETPDQAQPVLRLRSLSIIEIPSNDTRNISLKRSY